MADDDQFQASGNWWDNNSGRNNMIRYETVVPSQSNSSSNNIGNFAWQQQDHIGDIKLPRDSNLSPSSSVVFQDTQKLQLQPPRESAATSSGDPNLHMMMGLGLSSSQPMDWNQVSSLRGEKGGADNSFRSMLQESTGMGLSHQVQWRPEKLFSSDSNSSTNEFKQVNNRGFSLDQNQFSPHHEYSSGDSSTVTSQGMPSTFQMDSSALYGGSPSSILQGVLGPDNNNQQHMNFPYPTSYNGLNNSSELIPSWSKVPQFLRGASPPKQPQPHHNHLLHFTNNAPFWNASETAASSIKDVQSNFFPSLQTPFSTPINFDVQSKNVSEVRDSGAMVKKSGSEPAPKRSKNETPSPLPAFKVRKEKMGDRITALQQLVSPFGKTDTASVLSEAIEYIKFLHEQVTVLSTPYMKGGAPIMQQSSGKSKEGDQSSKQDLRSRGLCLVPVSSTFPVTHETTVDFWTPTFGGSSR